jgi:two-component system NtrC family sensor kinase
MTNSVRFPIRAKLLLLVSGLILGATAAYLALAVGLFREDKAALVYELNTSTVKTLAAETQASLGKVVDKVLLLTQGHRDEQWVKAIFEAEPDLVSFSLYEPGVDKPVLSIRNEAYLKLYNLGASDVDSVRKAVPVPFAKVLAKRSWAANATLPNGAPILTVAVALETLETKESGRGAATPTLMPPSETAPSAAVAPATGERIAVVDIRLDKWLKLVAGGGIATAYIVDAEGAVVAHPDSSLVTTRASLAGVPIVREALESTLASQTKTFSWNGESWIGAFATVGIGGLHVISQVPEAEAFRAARRLIDKSIVFALLVVTAGLLISGWMARGITEPLERLLEATEKLSRWEGGAASSLIHVRTRDELARLARAFNSMSTDLHSQRAQLEASRSELEIRVKQRTEALETEKRRVSEAQEALFRTTRLASLGELAGAAAHEVLNPVNNMSIRVERQRTRHRNADNGDIKLLGEILSAWKQSYAQGGWSALERDLKKQADGGRLMIEEDLDNLVGISTELARRQAERGEDIEFFAREITRITRIVNSMRALSRVGGERKPVDIHIPLEDTAVTLADLFEKRKVALVKDFSAGAREQFAILADKDELVQVFANLLRNALHAIAQADRRAPIIRISTTRTAERVEIRIADNGTGIRQEHLKRIFEPDFTTKSVEEGTGLGLSISRRIVRAFSGDLDVEKSIEGEGTTFLIWFPAIPRNM